MKTKTEAAKVLLDNGWSFEDIDAVLGEIKAVNIPFQSVEENVFIPPFEISAGCSDPYNDKRIVWFVNNNQTT